MNSDQNDEASVSISPRHTPDTSDIPSSSNPNTSFTFVLNDPAQPPQTGSEHVSQADRFAHTRTKRKRTSPSDFAILEREYEREPRPDRAARTQIAVRVSLSQKEVQIWFQNRRQMTRRKARLWQPNEISEIIRSSHRGSTSPLESHLLSSQSSQNSGTSFTEKAEPEINEKPAFGLFQNTSTQNFPFTGRGGNRVVERLEGRSSGNQTDDQLEQESKEKLPVDVSEEKENAQKRDEGAPELTVEAPSYTEVEAIVPPLQQDTARTLKRTSSNVRLRMSLEGKAELVLDGSSPSPPSKNSRRESWPARGPLQRSQSALITTSSTLDQAALAPSSSLPSSQSWSQNRAAGRSRDARTWEFYCDADARDALSIAAEHDHRGSAEAAIGLLRSNSGAAGKGLGSPLMPSLCKHNSFAGRKPYDAERIDKRDDKENKQREKRKSLENLPDARPKLARTASSIARLQSSNLKTSKSSQTASILSSSQPTLRGGGKQRAGVALEIYKDPDTDSDKENWQPGTRVSVPTHPRRARLNAGTRSALGTNLTEMSHESSLGALMASKSGGKASQVANMKADQLGSDEADDEVAVFMGEKGSRSGEVAQGEDLNAVQNLLSLSQGRRWS